MAPSSALPIGASRAISEMQPVLVDPSQPGSGLMNGVLALLAPTEGPMDDDATVDTEVAGFIMMYASLSSFFHLFESGLMVW